MELTEGKTKSLKVRPEDVPDRPSSPPPSQAALDITPDEIMAILHKMKQYAVDGGPRFKSPELTLQAAIDEIKRVRGGANIQSTSAPLKGLD
jgi:hypothetical protein